MKQLLLNVFLTIFPYLLLSQVGIGTNNPTKDLDINGELRVRNLPILTSSELLTTDQNGNIGKYQSFLLHEVGSSIATNNVDYTKSGAGIINNINLGLSQSVTIPANKEAVIIINYSVPVGIAYLGGLPNVGYYGIRFLKNGVEEQSGSRKFSIINNYSSTNTTANMVSINNTYIENVTASSLTRTFVFSLNGYIEQIDSFANTYRFNMWSSTGQNYNWGKAIIIKTVYLK